MKAVLTTLSSLIFCTVFVNGQQSQYSGSDFIKSGDYFIYQASSFIESPVPVNELTSDGWNYIYPTEYTIDTTFARTLAEFGLENLFPTADLALSIFGHNSVLKLNDNKLWVLGFIVNIEITDTAIPIVLPQPVDIMHFPLTVGSSISRSQSLPLTFTPEQMGITAADLGIPVTPDSIRINLNIEISSSIDDYKVFGKIKGAYLENSSTTVGYTVQALFWGMWVTLPALADSRSMELKNYWMPGFGLPICSLTLAPESNVLEFKIHPESIVGVKLKEERQTLIYPNPANDHINIIKKPAEDILIVDQCGRTVEYFSSRHEINHIDISHLRSGIYHVIINNNSIKLVKL